MNIKEIRGLSGFAIEQVEGSCKWYYQVSDLADLYDLKMMVDIGEMLKGSEIIFISYPEGKVYIPFEKQEKIYFQKPIFFENKLYFLKGDFSEKIVSVIEYTPEKDEVNEVISVKMEEVDLYNLEPIKTPLSLVSQNNSLEIYYPERLSIKKEYNESFLCRDGDKFYFSAWFEKGVNPNGSIVDDYEYYEEVIVKDKDSNILAKDLGFIKEMENGDFWKIVADSK